MTAVTVLLVDDHPIVRAGLRSLLERRGDVEIIGEAASGEEAVAIAVHLHPDVVLCDLRLGDGMNGVETTTALRAQHPAPAVVILTTFDRDAEILGAIEAGAAGYLVKDVSPDVIVQAVRQAADGRMVLAPDLSRRVADRRREPRVRLTARELDVLRLLETGASNREIAKSLFITEATVKTHLVHVFSKLGAGSRARALAVARENGLL